MGLPANAVTVRHDHEADRVEDLYVITSGDGWVIVDGDEIPVRNGLYVAVDLHASRHLRAGTNGLTFTALCGASRSVENPA